MKRSLRAALFLGAACAASAYAAPEVLVVQIMRGEAPEESVELNLASEVADELSKEGRVVPIVWSLSDPVFRLSAEEGLIPRFKENPSDKEISDTAQKLRVKYVLTVQAYRYNGILFPRAYLYEVGRNRPVWEFGPENQGNVSSFVVNVNGQPDWIATSRSLANTWATQLNLEPFKDLARRDPTFNNVTGPGIGTTVPGGVAIDASAGKEALDKAQELIEKGRTDLGVLYLRDAIDVNPYEPDRREMLVELLLDLGLVSEAADEAQRAAELTGSGSEIWLLAARCWISAQQPEKADTAIKEALARGGEGPAAKRILGQIRLLEGRPQEAVDLLSEALEAEESFEAYMARGLAYALLGNASASAADLEQVEADSKPLTVRLYMYCVSMISERGRILARRLADLPSLVATTTNPDQALAMAESIESETDGLATFLTKVTPPLVHQKSHATRDLAHKVLRQAALEALSYARGVNPDAKLESALSLGEALKLFRAVEEQMALEREG